jgi:2-hydroxychromene-2-carboxylate isomerase
VIASREAVRAAFERAMGLVPDEDAAVAVVAQSMGLTPEAVREALQPAEVPA